MTGPGIGVFALDWLETAGCVLWEPDRSRQEFLRLHDLQQQAVEAKEPIPVNYGPHQGFLHPRGLGSGNQTRLSYRFDFHGILVAVSPRDDATRRFHNVYINVPGRACLVHGAAESRQLAHDVVEQLGGHVSEEWLRRLDVCLDLPNYALQDVLQPAFDEGRFLTSAKTWNPWDGAGGKTGFTVGTRKRLSLNVYDKLVDWNRTHDEVYRQAMIDRRWSGRLPKAATRVEYTLSGSYLKDIGARDASDSLANLGAIIEKITCPAPRPFFRMTDVVPDRKNKHQSRVETLPDWAAIIAGFQKGAGEPIGELAEVYRGRMQHSRKYKLIRGYIASAAAEFGIPIRSFEEGVEMLRTLHDANFGTDDEWEAVYEKKAREAGTLSSRATAI